MEASQQGQDDQRGDPNQHCSSFAIDDCSLLRGSITDRDQQMVRYWHAQAGPLLVRVWNETRPSDCPIGPIALPDSSHK